MTTITNQFPTPESPTPPIRANEWGLKLPGRDSFSRTTATHRAYLSPSPPSPSPTKVTHEGHSHKTSAILRTPSPRARPPPLVIPTEPYRRASIIAAPAVKVVPSAVPSETPIVPSQSGVQAERQGPRHGVERPTTTLWEKRWMRHPYSRSQSLGDLLDRAQQTHRALYRDAALPIGEMSYIDHYQAKDERLRRIRSSHVISEQRRRESIDVGFERLKSLLPFGDYVDGMAKAQILQHAADYIIKLERSIKVLARDED